MSKYLSYENYQNQFLATKIVCYHMSFHGISYYIYYYYYTIRILSIAFRLCSDQYIHHSSAS
jgi:hypothetical protein